ncbi:uncharacterized protein LOC128546704 [Mercenaria mercenaria]|uniref:uncharacterized protein LOC128546704 n=1 Tax=Mercenaria mercenaria TaxID=6596 RepID=UPI00234E4251|nr:uncharacterized protein LOC128546704 [Mercenaria mercenaria]
MAYPTAPNDVRETLTKEQFMDALINSDMRIRVKQARPINLNDAVRHAVELEAYNKAERKHLESQGFISSADDQDKMSETCFAEDTALDIRGKTKVFIEIQGVKCVWDVAVADIDIDAIIGLDFLKAQKCQVDAVSDTLTIHGQTCKLRLAGKIGYYSVYMSEKVNIPPFPEVIVKGKVSVPSTKRGMMGLIEPAENSLYTGKTMIAKTLVKQSDTIPLRLMNAKSESEIIYPGTYVANLSEVTKVRTDNAKTPRNKVNNHKPEHLQNLYQKTIIGMSTDQQRHVSKLLIKYASVFSQSDHDLGGTNIIRHKISTGNAKPIKQQPLRRVQVHMEKEVEEQLDTC